MACLFFVIASIVAILHTTSAAPTKWIDLTYQMAENETIYWPGQPFWKHNVLFNGFIGPNKVFMSTNEFAAGEHGGTHMDAPSHFTQHGSTLEKITIDNLHGEGIVVNISAKVDKNPNAELEISDLEKWERKHGRIPDNPVVFMYSGRGKYWPDKEKYFGTDTPNDSSTFNFPGLHKDAAKWLMDNKKIKLFGLDTPSFDKGNATVPKTHQVLLGAGVPGIENVANLDKLPPRGFEVFAFPVKIKDGSGGPTRVFAKITATVDVDSAAIDNRVSTSSFALVMMLAINFML